ncbi:MAG: hypothetical protein ACREND_14800 [Gemmatimonadaceae bacterium]
MHRSSRVAYTLLSVAAVIAMVGCIFRGVRVAPLSRAEDIEVRSPVKVHLLNGETAVFEDGLRVAGDTVRGAGVVYGLTQVDRARGISVRAIPLDSVAAMESFSGYTKSATSVAVSTLLVGGGIVGGVALLKELFGSCPTIYSDSAGTPVLEAEGFSYSISPLLERRDIHRLRAEPDSHGVLALDVRNEALETHYINQLELLGVTRGADEYVLPDAREHALAVRELKPISRAVDRAGNDVTGTIAHDDGLVFRSDLRTIDHVSAGDLDDWIDLTIPVSSGTDSVALLFNLRNSLLNTVLLYDEMLSAQGAHAVDFEAEDLNNISDMVRIGRWYGGHMGMHVSVRRGSRWDTVAYVPDAGPIAWREVAAVVPAPPGDTLRVRLSFVADEWRIGKIGVAMRLRHPAPETFAPSALVEANGAPADTAMASVAALDARYLETTPGQRFTLRFTTGAPPRDSVRTFLLATEGYYTEWVRGKWIRQARATGERSFSASDTTLAETVRHWRDVAPTFESQFAHTRIPTGALP